SELSARIRIRPHLDRWPEAATWAHERRGGLVTCDGVKLLLDREWHSVPGSGGGYTYRYPGFPTATEWVMGAHTAGLNVTIHAVGDLAVHEALDVFERATAGAPTRRNHRISHARRIAPEDIPRFARLGVSAEMQPCDMVDQLQHMNQRFPASFRTTAYPFAALLRSGARLLFGSDWRLDQRADLSDLDPLQGILAATACAVPGQGIDVANALASYTFHRAIEVGGRADLTVLSHDVVGDGVDALAAARVLLSIVDGQLVYTTA